MVFSVQIYRSVLIFLYRGKEPHMPLDQDFYAQLHEMVQGHYGEQAVRAMFTVCFFFFFFFSYLTPLTYTKCYGISFFVITQPHLRTLHTHVTRWCMKWFLLCICYVGASVFSSSVMMLPFCRITHRGLSTSHSARRNGPTRASARRRPKAIGCVRSSGARLSHTTLIWT